MSVCSSHGTCSDGKCSSCKMFYEGKDCCKYWGDYKGWTALFWTYDAIVLTAAVVLLVATVYQFYVFWQIRRGKTKWTLVSQAFLGIFFYLLIRCIYYAIDPHGFRHIFSVPVESFLFWIPLWFLMIVAFLIVLYWIELQNHFMKLRELPSINKLRPVLIVGGIAAAAILLPLGIVDASLKTKTTGLLLNAFLAVALLSVSIFSAIYGFKLLRMLKNLMQPKQEYIKKISQFVLEVNAFLVFAVLLIIAYTIRGKEAYSWVIYQLLLRFCEMSGIVFLLLLLRKKRPPAGTSDSGNGSKRNTDISMPTINTNTDP